MIKVKKQHYAFKKFELKNTVLKTILKNRKLKSGIRWYFGVLCSQQQKRSSKTPIKNRCVISMRSRSVYRFARVSRLVLRDPNFIGTFPGLRKSSW